LLRDVVLRDVAARHHLRETRHVMNLLLFLFAHTGQPFSLQSLTKNLAIPTVGQTSRYLEFLQDAYLLLAVPKFSASFKQRVVAPAKFYATDNGLRRANSPQFTPDLGARLENTVALALRSQTRELFYAGERDRWECDFVTPEAAIQVCAELTPANQTRELRGLSEALALPGQRRGLIITLDQSDQLALDGHPIQVVPAWRWLQPLPASPAPQTPPLSRTP
jgi:predicted AAA+ superfamily ATPase